MMFWQKHIVIKVLSKRYLQRNIAVFIDILKELSNEQWKEEHFLLELPNKFKLSLVAIINGKPVGYIIASQKNNYAYIHMFVVKKEYQGKQVGTKLQEVFEKRCTRYGLPKIMLAVHDSNRKAISFYKRNGYKTSRCKKDKFGEKLIIPEKVL